MTAPRPRQDFPRTARLRTSGEFRQVQRAGRSHDLGPLVVRVAPRPSDEGMVTPGRLGLAISRRVGNAVDRNRVKRRVRDWFRRHRAGLEGLDLVVSGREQAARLDQAEVDALLGRLLGRIGRGTGAPPASPGQTDG